MWLARRKRMVQCKRWLLYAMSTQLSVCPKVDSFRDLITDYTMSMFKLSILYDANWLINVSATHLSGRQNKKSIDINDVEWEIIFYWSFDHCSIILNFSAISFYWNGRVGWLVSSWVVILCHYISILLIRSITIKNRMYISRDLNERMIICGL